jgi:hypothetical protein
MKSIEREQESLTRVNDLVTTFNSREGGEISDEKRVKFEEGEKGGADNAAFTTDEEGLEMKVVSPSQAESRKRTKSILDLEKPGLWDQFSVLLR